MMRSGLPAAIVGTMLATCAQANDLDPFIGRDFSEHRLTPSEKRLIASRLGRTARSSKPLESLWRIWRSSDRLVALWGFDPSCVPCIVTATIQVFKDNESLDYVDQQSFQAGYRAFFSNASVEFVAPLGRPLLVLETEPAINGRKIAKQYYSFHGDQIRLVRIENQQGDLLTNHYHFSNLEIGMAPRATTARQWLRLLDSSDESEVLSALVLLGGRHIASEHRRFEEFPYQSIYVPMLSKLLGDPLIQSQIQNLRKSTHEWIREAAVLTAFRLPDPTAKVAYDDE
jgi:hypothetical protein